METQQPFNDAVVSALIDCLPEQWQSARLEIFRSSKPEGEAYSVGIVSPVGRPEVVTASPELLVAIEALGLLLEHLQQSWQSLHFQVTTPGNGAWDYRYRSLLP